MVVFFLTAVISPARMGLLLGIMVLTVALVGWFLMRRRRDIWRGLARRHGLTFINTREGPRVVGSVNDRHVEFATLDKSSDAEAGVVVVRIIVELRGVPKDLSAESTPGLLGDLVKLAQDGVEVGSESFERDVLVQGDDIALSREYWNIGVRQKTFLDLLRMAPCDRIFIRDGTLIAELRSIFSDRLKLERLLDLLLAAAHQFDCDTVKDKE